MFADNYTMIAALSVAIIKLSKKTSQSSHDFIQVM